MANLQLIKLYLPISCLSRELGVDIITPSFAAAVGDVSCLIQRRQVSGLCHSYYLCPVRSRGPVKPN